MKSKVKFSTLFKHLLIIRSDDYTSDDLRATKIVFSYHIYSIEYKYTDEEDDLLLFDINET